MDLLTSEALNAEIAAIYEAAASPERWVDVLARLRQRFHLTFATAASYTADRRHVQARAVGIDQRDYQSFLDKYFRDNQFSRETTTRAAGGVVPSRSFIDPATFQRSDMYQEFHRARDMGEGLRLDIWQEAGNLRSIAFFRPWSLGPYEAAELAFCRALMPHLQRAAALNHRLHQADLLALTARTTLDALPQPVFLLDADRRVRYANPAAEALLRAGDGLRVENGLLIAANAAHAGRLDLALARAAGQAGAAAGSAVRLPKVTGVPLSLLLMPCALETSILASGRPTILVLAVDPERSPRLATAQLVALFGLTEAEALLANDLLTGDPIQDIAARRGRSVNTMRTHLARLMAKTDVNRQSQLMQLLVNLPRLPDS